MIQLSTSLYETLCSTENIELAFKKARKGKTLRLYVIEFEENLAQNLLQLQTELRFLCYAPKPLTTFILRDPKTRKISKSDFRDRVVHHAICNVIESFFEKSFIYDSFANRKSKGTFKAIERFEQFAHSVSKNNSQTCYVLKADIRHYFETVNHNILLTLIARKINDAKVLNLIRIILANHKTKEIGKGMPLGNLTSQFFANVYLNELDQFVKHKLNVKHYVRYVDDFVILHHSSTLLTEWKEKINYFLKTKLLLDLHPDKSRILRMQDGIPFLGMRIYPYHKRIQKRNILRFRKKFKQLRCQYQSGRIMREKVLESFEGWLAYTTNANAFKYRKHLVRQFNTFFPLELPVPESHIKKEENFIKKEEASSFQFSVQKTLLLFKKGLTISTIAEVRGIKVNTVWDHLANVIEYNQLSLWKVIKKEKAKIILGKIHSEKDTLRQINTKLNSSEISYNDIACCLAYVKSKNRVKHLYHHIKWYKNVHCMRKCYFNKPQRLLCGKKFLIFQSKNAQLQMTKQDFVDLCNNHLNICVLPEKEKNMIISWQKFQDIKQHFVKRRE